jgi:hypothetical protein
MFQQFISVIWRSYYLRSYSSNICVVDVYGLQFVQCDQLSRDATPAVFFMYCVLVFTAVIFMESHTYLYLLRHCCKLVV